ncbi:hypothetical protein RHSIM_Rhsim10G0093400 [Rhododendron simsii]|uniref:Uncharacterized protein n=1 Tax=Rhododendron simsii TaxID=118357 RepID=A0A834LCU4_RHOSS|nr:hypothetical protein RHSIM_Rhsim10G0093400 [Rhododendron simsii]
MICLTFEERKNFTFEEGRDSKPIYGIINWWRPSSPAKSGNGRSPFRGANRGEDTNRHSNSERDLEVRDLEITGFQEQIGDTGENEAFQAGNSQQILPFKKNSAAKGNLKPRALGPSLEQEEASRPNFCLDPITLTLVRNEPTIPSPHKPNLIGDQKAKSSTIISVDPLIPTNTNTQISPLVPHITISTDPNINPPTRTINIPTPDPNFLRHSNTALPKNPQFENPTQLISSHEFSEGVFSSGLAPSSQKKRGRPVGSKSKSDKRRGQIPQSVGSKSVNEVSSSSGATVRVGSKRPSSVGDNRSSACDGDEVCSPAKKPRLGGGNSEASQDSVMDEAFATDTVEEASRNWPQDVK